MPRKRSARANTVTSAFRQVQQQARSLMVNLRKEIRSKETELQRLKDEESRLSMLIEGQPSPRSARSAAARAGTRGGRVNWLAVLDQLPKQFKAGDVRMVKGLKGKRPSEVFAAITRWIQMGSARRKARGLYERI
jgi:hypothetical protein